MLISGRTEMPGVAMSTSRKEMPRCFAASGSVRTSSAMWSAACAREVQIFCPFTVYSSPSRTALVCSEARSEPAPGSEKPWHQARSPESVLEMCSAFSSSVPWMMIAGPIWEMPCPPTCGASAFASSWLRMNCSTEVIPPPPYSTGQAGAIQPRSASARAQLQAASRTTGSSEMRSICHSSPEPPGPPRILR